MQLSIWKNTVSDFFTFSLFPLSKSTWKPFWGIEQVGVRVEPSWSWDWAGQSKAAPTFSMECTEVKDSEVQRPNGSKAAAKHLWGAFSGEGGKTEGIWLGTCNKSKPKSLTKVYPCLVSAWLKRNTWINVSGARTMTLSFFTSPKLQNIYQYLSL